jgi:hypothetical protein
LYDPDVLADIAPEADRRASGQKWLTWEREKDVAGAPLEGLGEKPGAQIVRPPRS